MSPELFEIEPQRIQSALVHVGEMTTRQIAAECATAGQHLPIPPCDGLHFDGGAIRAGTRYRGVHYGLATWQDLWPAHQRGFRREVDRHLRHAATRGNSPQLPRRAQRSDD